MSSIRVPTRLLADLHEAAPPGTSLPALLRDLLGQAGGPAAVRARMERESRRLVAATRVRRLEAQGHRSVLLTPNEQETLAQACVDWAGLLAESGDRIHDPAARTIHIRAPGPLRRTAGRIRIQRRGGILP